MVQILAKKELHPNKLECELKSEADSKIYLGYPSSSLDTQAKDIYLEYYKRVASFWGKSVFFNFPLKYLIN